MDGGPHADILRDMHRALLAEFGARAIYAKLIRLVRDDELRDVLSRMYEEEGPQIETLRRVMTELGGKPAERSLRRRALARALAWASLVTGTAFVMRICHEAQRTAAVWYARYRQHLVQVGEPELADRCGDMSLVKSRHAELLEAWLRTGRRGH